MKKLIFLFFAVLGATLTSCSCFDSEPINPKIIGSGTLKYDTLSELWYAVVDSTQYAVAQITIPDHNPRTLGVTQDIEPVDGMLVTLFTSKHTKGVQAVAGEQSVQQIEKLYHTNSTIGVILFALLILCVLGLGFLAPGLQKVHVVHTDS